MEWFEIGEHGQLPQLVRQVAADSARILLVSACAAYHPCLFEMIRDWDGQGEVMALTTHGQFVVSLLFLVGAALEIASKCPAFVETPLELYAWFKPSHFVVVQGSFRRTCGRPSVLRQTGSSRNKSLTNGW